ncbi:MAG TPA: hypothetical protein VFS43_22955 [Polyangiaceae bacterium]|nr:hypothetical protein [Polyangiaceae bacterium]
MSDEVPIWCEGVMVESEAGVRLLVVTFEGTYGHGCQGNGDAAAMLEAVERLVREHPEAEGAVLDATRLDYEWGDRIGSVSEPLAAMPWAWAVSERSAGRCGLTSYVEAEMGMRPGWPPHNVVQAARVT